MPGRMRVHVQIHLVGVVAGPGVECRFVRCRPRPGRHSDERLSGVPVGERLVDAGAIAREQAGRNWNLNPHPAPKGADRRHELRFSSEPRVADHLRDVLVDPVERIGRLERQVLEPALGRLPPLDEGAAAPGVARKGVHRERGVGSEQARIDEGLDEEHEPARIAARIRNALRGGDGGALFGVELRQPVRPVFRDPVSRARVHEPGPACGGPPGRIARRVVGQAEHGDVGLLHPFAASRRILSLRLGKVQELEVVAPHEPVANAKPGGAHVAIDIDLRPVGRHLSLLLAPWVPAGAGVAGRAAHRFAGAGGGSGVDCRRRNERRPEREPAPAPGDDYNLPRMFPDRIHSGPIRAVTFDLDDTLWDVEPAIARAERDLRTWLDANCPEMAARYDREALFRIRGEIIAQRPPLRHDVSELRVQVLKSALLRTGRDAQEAERLARAGFEVFLASRHAIEYYDYAAEVLRKLRRRYVLGVLTNGNADVRRLDIGPLFHFAIQAGEVGSSKPEPVMFKEAMRRTRLRSREIVHVGDHLENDVAGAKRLGWYTVWVNRANAPRPAGAAAADGEVACLSELPAVIDRIEAAARSA